MTGSEANVILIVETFANASAAVVWQCGSQVDDEKLCANICFHSWPHHYHGFASLFDVTKSL